MGQVVHLIRETKSALTNEAVENGKPVGRMCDHTGKVLGRDEDFKRRDVYMDSFSGAHFMRITHEEKEQLAKDGDEDKIFQGIGEVHGWFQPAPDYTLKGRHGDGAPNQEHEEQVMSVA